MVSLPIYADGQTPVLGGTLDVLLHVLDLLPNPVYVKDRQHRWIEANKAFCDLLGRPREKLLGLSDYDFNPPEQADIFWAMDDEVFDSRGSNVNHEETVTSEGQSLWVESRKSYFQADDGAEYLVGVLTDLTEMKAREDALAAAEQKAQAAAKAKSEFLANMSHEIRTPMNGVLGMTQILQNTELSQPQSEMVETLSRSGHALLSLIDDILDFSKIEAGRLSLSADPFEFRPMVDDVAALLGPKAREKGLDLLIHYKADLPSFLIGDEGRLRQILMNLIGNAIKFTKDGFVAVHMDGHAVGDRLHLSIQVEDSGIGIPEDKLSTIFEKFQQADGSTTRLYGGTGLGLAISRDLAELMGGSLTVTSTVGTGSCFELTLNLPVTEGAPKSYLDHNAEKPALDHLKILAVDDIGLNLDILRSQLGRLGLQVDCHETPKSGVEALIAAYQQGEPYNLLITDFQMPDVDGLEFARALKKKGPFTALPILVMSSVNDVAVRESFKAISVDHYLVKPVKRTDLERMIFDVATIVKAREA